jgi:predicted dehydrogenase
MINSIQPPQTDINWGIIGCGNVTEVKSGPAFNKVPGSRLIAVMRRDAVKAKDYALRHQVPKWYTDARQLINDPEVNAIYIATPPKFHEEYTIAALRAGKSVYVEKPMATDIASCLRMQAMSHEMNVKLCIAHYRRGLPMFIKIKQLIDEQVIGKIRTVRLSMLQPHQSAIIANSETNWRVNPAISGAGLFYDLAPHQLDLMMHFFGAVAETYGVSANQAGLYEAEDVVAGVIRFTNNIIFSGQWCFTVADGMQEDVCEMVGTKGKISFPVFGNEISLDTGKGKKILEFAPPAHIQQPMIEKVTDYFLSKGSNPCSASDAIESMKVIENFVYGSKQAG